MQTPELDLSEDRAAKVAKTPWRVNLEALKRRVVTTEYLHPVNVPHMTIAVLVLDNGYALQGMSAPADPLNFNEKLGQEYAFEDALRKMWALEAYVMCDAMTGFVKVTNLEKRWEVL